MPWPMVLEVSRGPACPESWRKLAEAGGSWRKLAEAGGSWRKLAEAGGSWRKLAEAGGSWRSLGWLGRARLLAIGWLLALPCWQ
ncbi:hypothetical protein [Psychromarinibacter sp. S121]|uniref:hypothetical protein n=1 Tax=Psychromarinibacter sp. S121 TaxID=3415127 RepID=UPI003C7B4D9C